MASLDAARCLQMTSDGKNHFTQSVFFIIFILCVSCSVVLPDDALLIFSSQIVLKRTDKDKDVQATTVVRSEP